MSQLAVGHASRAAICLRSHRMRKSFLIERHAETVWAWATTMEGVRIHIQKNHDAMSCRKSCYIVFAWALVPLGSANAIDEFKDLRLISELPKTKTEIAAAFKRSGGNRCELIPSGMPVEVNSYMSYLTDRDRREAKGRPIPSKRKNLFSVGLEFESRDKLALPRLSRSAILDYVDSHCVQIQARIRRDLLDRKLYYHHRPLALTKKYRGVRLTQDFEPVVAGTVKDFHGIGLFNSQKSRFLKPEMLRTLVLLFKTELLTGVRSREAYEFVFVHGVEKAGELEPHIFVTTGDRAKLSYLRSSSSSPGSARTTSILGRIRVTDFDGTGLYPKESAIRSYRLKSSQEFEWNVLDEAADEKGLKGGFSANVDTVLAAIVAGELSRKSNYSNLP